MPSDILDSVHAYLDRGWKPIPVKYQSKQPAVSGWRHLTVDRSNAAAYFDIGPVNVGILLGTASGNLVDVDIDDERALLLSKHFLPPTDFVFGRPSRPSAHRLYISDHKTCAYKHPETGKMLLEIRSTGAQTVFPPSVHVSGEPITAESSGTPATVEPQSLRQACNYLAVAVVLSSVWPSGPGDRQHRAMALAGAFLKARMSERDAKKLILLAAHGGGDEEAARRIEAVSSAAKRLAEGKAVWGWSNVDELFGVKVGARIRDWLEIEVPGLARTAKSASPIFTVSDFTAEADRFSGSTSIDQINELIRRLAEADLPYLAVDSVIEQIAKRTTHQASALHAALRETRRASYKGDEETAEQAVRNRHFAGGEHLAYVDREFWTYKNGFWATITEAELKGIILETVEAEGLRVRANKNGLIGNVLGVLEGRQARSADYLGLTVEPKPVINVQNGELWFTSTGDVELRPHRPESRLTYKLNVAYNETATCPTYDRVLADIFANATTPMEMVRHFNEFAGYAIQPTRQLAAFFLLYGEGGNGKSKLMDVVQSLMGAGTVYCARIQTLETNRFATAELCGRLMFFDDDLRVGTRFPDGLIKAISEDKMISGERKFGSTFEFRCLALPVFACNTFPNVADLSIGLRRRANVIPFNRVFGPGEANPKLFDAIKDHELPGVLNRLIEGFKRLVARGRFEQPVDCQNALAEWLRNANPVKDFIDSEYEIDPGSSIDLTDLFDAYRIWARRSGISALGSRLMFRNSIAQLGFGMARHNGYTVVKGIRQRRAAAA